MVYSMPMVGNPYIVFWVLWFILCPQLAEQDEEEEEDDQTGSVCSFFSGIKHCCVFMHHSFVHV